MKVLGFAVVGGVGFLVDGGILTLLSMVAHTNIYLARGASFSSATLATWLLNRTFVFQAEPRFGRRRGDRLREISHGADRGCPGESRRVRGVDCL